MFIFIAFFICFIIAVVSGWKGVKIWQEGNKPGSIGTVILSIFIVVLCLLLILGIVSN